MPDAEHAPPRRQQRDLTSGPIAMTLLLFALPTLGSNVLQSLNGSINAVWVGRFLGESALAATSNANLIMFLMNSAVFGFGMAATILIGQNVGRGAIDDARRVMGTALGLLVGISAVIAVAGWLGAPALLRLLATPADVQPLALAYLRVIFLAMPGAFLMVLLMMGLRGAGDSLTPLWFMLLSVLLDSGLNPLLIAGIGPFPRLGIAGAATATLIANYVSVAGLMLFIYWRDLPIRLRGQELRYLRPDMALLRIIAAKGTPMGLQMVMMSLSALVMIGLVNREGTEVTAAYGLTQQLWTYVQMPALAIGAAVSAMAAQNIGAGRWDRVGRITGSGLLFNLLLTGGLLAFLTLIDRQALGLFIRADSPAIAIAARINLMAGWSFVLFGLSMVLFATVRANGAVVGPLIALVISTFVVRLGFAYGLYPQLGRDAIWWSFPVGSVATLLLAMAYYRFGHWRGRALVQKVDQATAAEQALADGDAVGKIRPTA